MVFSCEYCEIFKNRFLNRTPLVAAFVNLIKNYSVLGICRLSLINQLEWFSVERFVDLSRTSSLHTITRNHSNTFLFIKMKKTKTCSK